MSTTVIRTQSPDLRPKRSGRTVRNALATVAKPQLEKASLAA